MMFDTLKMLVYKFNEQKKELRQNLKQFFCRHDYVKKEGKQIFCFSSKYYLECPKCGKRSSIEPWLNYREEEPKNETEDENVDEVVIRKGE